MRICFEIQSVLPFPWVCFCTAHNYVQHYCLGTWCEVLCTPNTITGIDMKCRCWKILRFCIYFAFCKMSRAGQEIVFPSYDDFTISFFSVLCWDEPNTFKSGKTEKNLYACPWLAYMLEMWGNPCLSLYSDWFRPGFEPHSPVFQGSALIITTAGYSSLGPPQFSAQLIFLCLIMHSWGSWVNDLTTGLGECWSVSGFDEKFYLNKSWCVYFCENFWI